MLAATSYALGMMNVPKLPTESVGTTNEPPPTSTGVVQPAFFPILPMLWDVISALLSHEKELFRVHLNDDLKKTVLLNRVREQIMSPIIFLTK